MKITVSWDVTKSSQNIPMKEAAGSFETLEPSYQNTRHHIRGDSNFIFTDTRPLSLTGSLRFHLAKTASR